MSRVAGLLPMAGNGSRAGFLFPKPLAPIPRDGLAVPIYRLVTERMKAVTDEIFGFVAEEDKHLFNLPDISIHALPGDRGTAAGNIGRAARILQGADYDEIMVGLPDTYWRPSGAFAIAIDELRKTSAELVLLTAIAPAHEVDRVVTDGVRVLVSEHWSVPGPMVHGWVAFVARTSALVNWQDGSWAKNIMQSGNLRTLPICTDFRDAGTPARYFELVELLRKEAWS